MSSLVVCTSSNTLSTWSSSAGTSRNSDSRYSVACSHVIPTRGSRWLPCSSTRPTVHWDKRTGAAKETSVASVAQQTKGAQAVWPRSFLSPLSACKTNLFFQTQVVMSGALLWTLWYSGGLDRQCSTVVNSYALLCSVMLCSLTSPYKQANETMPALRWAGKAAYKKTTSLSGSNILFRADNKKRIVPERRVSVRRSIQINGHGSVHLQADLSSRTEVNERYRFTAGDASYHFACGCEAMKLTATLMVSILSSASLSGISNLNSSSRAMTTSTASKLSRPRSFLKWASGVTYRPMGTNWLMICHQTFKLAGKNVTKHSCLNSIYSLEIYGLEKRKR